MNLSKFSRRGYVKEPTPIEPLDNFSKAIGSGTRFWVKRDDLLPGCGGGNKTRKLDFCFADALDQGADCVITCGAVQSNHCRLTLSWAVKEGLDCYLVLEERVADSYDPKSSGNNLLFQLMGVSGITVVPGDLDMMAEMQKVADQLSKTKTPYIIPGGASNPLGATGYVACAQETMQQLFEMGLQIDHIVVPSGSAGTHAGMVVGIEGSNGNIPISGINVSRKRADQEQLVHDLAVRTAEHVGVTQGISRKSVTCFDDYVGPGYSRPTPEMVAAVKQLASTEAILLDPVYSGKAMAGLIDLEQKGRFSDCHNVLFLHTGGSPALFAYLETFQKA